MKITKKNSKAGTNLQVHACTSPHCKPYVARIRYKKKWIRIGTYYAGCNGFTPSDSSNEANISTTNRGEVEDLLREADMVLSRSFMDFSQQSEIRFQ